jgi:hypothetical protein
LAIIEQTQTMPREKAWSFIQLNFTK